MTAARNDLRLPVALIIMDGFGLEKPGPGNAISQALKPNLDRIAATCPWCELEASEEAVGLPAGQMGNSEVGHLNIGAGRVVYQELTRLNRACRDGSICRNAVLSDAMEAAKAPGAALHLMGLFSDGGVHSSNEHLYALLRMAAQMGVETVKVHCFLDGRDVPPESACTYFAQLREVIKQLAGQFPDTDIAIASVSGRYYAMDRDRRWDRVERAFNVLVEGRPVLPQSPEAAVQASYQCGVTDEFFVPQAFDSRGIHDGDAVVFYNFRPDRARQITRAFVCDDFVGFTRARAPKVHFVCLTEYDPEIPAPVAFAKEFPSNVLADVLSAEGLRQYHIAETEKYAHVTFFLNGGVEEPKAGEARKLIASPKVATYDLQPEMSEPGVTEALVAAIDAGEADVYIVNFANCDMVGHTGVIPAAVAAVEAVDEGVGAVCAAIARKGGAVFLTADHGNADKMIAEDGSPHTAHTCAHVPFAFIDGSDSGWSLTPGLGALCDIAPTVLDFIGIPQPAQMTGTSKLVRNPDAEKPHPNRTFTY